MPSGGDVVGLDGDAMVGLVAAIAAVVDAATGPYAIVGGVGVSARLGGAFRATSDVDTLVDVNEEPTLVNLLVARGADHDKDADHRVYVDGTKVETIQVGEVTDAELDGLSDDDALFVAGGGFALSTATPLTVVASSAPSVRASALFATSAGLVATKLHAIATRSAAGAAKRGSDAADLFNLLIFDGPAVATGLQIDASPTLRRLVSEGVRTYLVAGAARSVAWMRAANVAIEPIPAAAELQAVAAELIESM